LLPGLQSDGRRLANPTEWRFCGGMCIYLQIRQNADFVLVGCLQIIQNG